MSEPEAPSSERRTNRWYGLLPWLITLVCFTYLYFQIDSQAARQGTTAVGLLASVFERVNWLRWGAIVCGIAGVAMILSVDADSAKPLNVGDFTADQFTSTGDFENGSLDDFG